MALPRYASTNTGRPVIQAFEFLKSSTGDRVVSFCEEKKLAHRAETLDSPDGFPSAQLHTIDVDPSCKGGALLYFHGGGFTYPAGPGHLKFASLLARRLRCRRLCMLEYTLLPDGKYPVQLSQGAAALRLLLGSHAPSEVVVAGDSAGGNLALSLLAHLKARHPKIEPVELAQPLAAAVCISPRCSNATTAPSFTSNAGRDFMDAAITASIVSKWKPVDGEVWAAANHGGKAFWADDKGIKVEKILVVAGEDECYVDDIRTFADYLGARDPEQAGSTASRQFVIAKGAVHVQSVIDCGVGKESGSMTKALLKWASSNPIHKDGK